jgi:hypothetical protein
MLWMGRHCPTSHEYDHTRNQVPLRASVSFAAQPDADESSGPPDDTHGCVLQVIVRPLMTPSVLGEGVDAAPSSDDQRIKELLAPACTSKPGLANQKQDDKEDSVGDKRAAHNEMRQTLSCMVGSAEAKGCDAPKYKLHPGDYWHGLANEAMSLDYDLPDLSMYTLFVMELQVDAHGDLGDEHEHDIWNELGVDVLGELPAFVLMPEEVSHDSEERAESLHGNVPFGADYLIPSVASS